jgi:hypothetical protein|tara:strand:+ start:356 stop:979 length:624 start_codon:yes stop_codon:yes gene_type:complete
METITLNLLLGGIILFGTIWWFYKIAQSRTTYPIEDGITDPIEDSITGPIEDSITDLIEEFIHDEISKLYGNFIKRMEELDRKIKESYELTVDPFKSTIDYKSMYIKPDYKDARAIRRNIKRLPGEKDHALNVRKQKAYKDARKWNDEQDRLENEFVAQKQVEEIINKLEIMKLQNEKLKLNAEITKNYNLDPIRLKEFRINIEDYK